MRSSSCVIRRLFPKLARSAYGIREARQRGLRGSEGASKGKSWQFPFLSISLLPNNTINDCLPSINLRIRIHPFKENLQSASMCQALCLMLDTKNKLDMRTLDTWNSWCVVVRRPPLRKKHKCSGCTEFGTLKLLKFTYTVGLNIQNLEQHGVGYITVTKTLQLYTLTVLTRNQIIFQAPHLKYWRRLIRFSYNVPNFH
jgi:hypothetical protein